MNRSRFLTKLGFAALVAASVPACVFTASGRVHTSGTLVVTEAPPQPQDEVVTPRSGYIWVHGRWDWQGHWVWVGGHWERERAGSEWADGRWEQRGNQWVWVEGEWRTGGAHGTVVVHDVVHENGDDGRVKVRDHRDEGNGGGSTTVVVVNDGRPHQPPPEPQAENPGTRSGYIWISGRWDWAKDSSQNWQWTWVPGHWERPKANQVWTDGHWELQGDAYVWIEGSWGASSDDGRVKVRDHRH